MAKGVVQHRPVLGIEQVGCNFPGKKGTIHRKGPG